MTDDDLKSIRRELISDGFECQGPRTFAGIPFALTAVRRRRAWSWLAWATRSFEDFYLFADFADLDADELLAFLTVCRAWAAPDARRLPILSQLRWPWVRRVYCVAMASRPTQGVLIHVRETPPLTADDNCTLIPVIYDSRRQETHLFRKLHLPPNLQLDHVIESSAQESRAPDGEPPIPRTQRAPPEVDTTEAIQEDVPELEAAEPQRASPGHWHIAHQRTGKSVVRPYTWTTIPSRVREENVQRLFESTRRGERMLFALLAGAAVAAFAGIAWGFLNSLAGVSMEWFPIIGLGGCVALAVRLAGRGMRLRFGLIGGMLTLLGYLVARHVSFLIAEEDQVHNLSPLANPGRLSWFLGDLLHWTSLASMALAVVQGYFFSFHRVRAREILLLAEKKPPCKGAPQVLFFHAQPATAGTLC